MYITRHVFTLKFMMIIVLATLFVSTTSIMEAHALLSTEVKCPCSFLSALAFAKIQAKKIGGSFTIEECTNAPDAIRAAGPIEPDFCSIEIEADLPQEDQEEVIDCSYRFECGEDEEPASFFILDFDVQDITEQEFEACRKEIKFISNFIYRVACHRNL